MRLNIGVILDLGIYSHVYLVIFSKVWTFLAICSPGYHSSGHKVCVGCPVNMYKNETGIMQCKHCPAGSTTDGAIASTECKPNGVYIQLAYEKLFVTYPAYLLFCFSCVLALLYAVFVQGLFKYQYYWVILNKRKKSDWSGIT